MLANNVQETTATTGAGTLTLAAITGKVRFSQAFAVGLLVPYALQSGDNWEWGWGTVGAGNTFTRDRITSTLVGAFYNNTAPGPITLSGTSTLTNTMPAQTNSLTPARIFGDAATHRRAISLPSYNAGSFTSFAMVANNIYFAPCYWIGGVISMVYADVSVAAAGKNLRIGLYAMDANGLPYDLLADSGNMSVGTVAGVSAAVPSMALPACWLYAAFISDGAPTIRGQAITGETPLGWSSATYRYKTVYLYRSGEAFGAFPAQASSAGLLVMGTGSANNCPVCWLGE